LRSPYDKEALEEEVERRVQAILTEEGEDPFSDSDHAMHLRDEIRADVRREWSITVPRKET